MLSFGLLALTALNADPSNLLEVERTALADPAPIRIWLNNSSTFREGERARVQIETRDDGYLMVFNYDAEGRLRVIFPIDPRDDNFVRGGRRYEVRGRGDRESFIVGSGGDGIVYAAVSPDPFRFDEIEAGGNWDYTRVSIGSNSPDPEADVTDLVLRLASDRGFDYDVVPYRVYRLDERYVGGWWYPRPHYYWHDHYCDPWYRPSLFGCSYYPTGGFYFGYASPYSYGWYGWGYRYPWYGTRYVYSGGRRNYPVVVGRPRAYTIVRRGDATGTTRVGSPAGSRGGRSVIDYRPRGGTRPNTPAVTRPSREDRPSTPSASRPRARRSPPPTETQRPTVERDGNRSRRPVDMDTPRSSEPRRSEPSAPRSDDKPRSEDRPRSSRPRGNEDGPRMERRVQPNIESSVRSQSAVRSEPRRSVTRDEIVRPERRIEARAEARPSVSSEVRRVEPRRSESRPEVRAEPRRSESRPEVRAEPRRSEPKPQVRAEPRRSEPRAAPAPRSEPRREAPRSQPSRPRSSRPRG